MFSPSFIQNTQSAFAANREQQSNNKGLDMKLPDFSTATQAAAAL